MLNSHALTTAIAEPWHFQRFKVVRNTSVVTLLVRGEDGTILTISDGLQIRAHIHILPMTTLGSWLTSAPLLDEITLLKNLVLAVAHNGVADGSAMKHNIKLRPVHKRLDEMTTSLVRDLKEFISFLPLGCKFPALLS